MTASPTVPETVTQAELPPHTHTRTDDAQGIAFGAVMAAFSAFLLGSAGLITGQLAGLALRAHVEAIRAELAAAIEAPVADSVDQWRLTTALVAYRADEVHRAEGALARMQRNADAQARAKRSE